METEPADCYVRAVQLAGDVELIRREMGRPLEQRPAVTVSDASPRECWFQALAVFRKSDRLCGELGGDPLASIPHAPPVHEIRPGHVLAVIEAASRELDEVKRSLGVKEAGAAPAREPSRTPSDVFGSLATSARQINLLLETPFTPAMVFQQVALAVAYAARLAGKAPPEPAPYVGGKRPADCYERLRGCMGHLRTLIQRAGHPMVTRPGEADAAAVLPSDCFDLASLVLGEVAFLHALAHDANPPHPWEGNRPGRKLPSHVWQLAGVLEQQLAALAR